MDSKPFYLSKIFWVNILTLAVMVLGILANDPNGYGVEVAKYAALALPIVNVVLRFVTNQAVTWK